MINKKYLTIQILEALGRDWSEIIKKKYGNSPQLVLGDAILGLLIYKTIVDLSISLNITESTLGRVLNKACLGKPKKYNKWLLWFTSLTEYKYCSSCDKYLLKLNYHLSKVTKDNLSINCTDCCRRYERAYSILYSKDNRGKRNAHEAKRRASKLQRTVSWANLEAIKELYKNCPEGYHVDHIIPLQGKNVSGLHIETNLQYLTAEANLKKGNDF